MSDKKAQCMWKCSKCKSSGYVSVVLRAGESPSDAAKRQTASTRGMCVRGCVFEAVPNRPSPRKAR